MAKVIGKGKAQVGKMGAIPTDSHLGTGVTVCVLTNVILHQSKCMQEKCGKETRSSQNNWKRCRRQ